MLDVSKGFTPPLGAGDYAFWVQEIGSGSFPYGLDFELEPAPKASVPDGGPGLLGCAAVGMLMAAARRRVGFAA